jgi:hypothetical protein
MNSPGAHQGGMDVEMFFVKTEELDRVRELVARRIASPPDPAGKRQSWGLPVSYDIIVAGQGTRRVALSPPVNGWVAGVESHEVLDFELLRQLSAGLQADVLAIQLSEVTGSCGYAWCLEGDVLEYHFSGDDADPAGHIQRYLRLHGVTIDLVGFNEAAQLHHLGWQVL